MFDVFTEEIEVAIKDGIANLYWYRGDLKKCWLRSGVLIDLADRIYLEKSADGNDISKRVMMDRLYAELRNGDFNRRLEVSRNFVRVLIEHRSFVPQSDKHRIEIAERSALKLKEIMHLQRADREYRESIQRRANEAKKEDYDSLLAKIREKFVSLMELSGQQRGYALEHLFVELMQASGIPVEEPFRLMFVLRFAPRLFHLRPHVARLPPGKG